MNFPDIFIIMSTFIWSSFELSPLQIIKKDMMRAKSKMAVLPWQCVVKNIES